ncbi:MAG: BsuPI-related putative proteinase inhibitor [Panacagrimonas sp.]
MKNFPAYVFCVVALSACSDDDRNSGSGNGGLCSPFTSTLAIKDRMNQVVSTFSAGEIISFEARVTNGSTSAQTLTTRNACAQVGFEASNSSAQIVWGSNDGITCGAALIDVTYAPGETKVYTAQWDQELQNNTQAPVGQYSVRSVDITQCSSAIDKTANFTLQ